MLAPPGPRCSAREVRVAVSTGRPRHVSCAQPSQRVVVGQVRHERTDSSVPEDSLGNPPERSHLTAAYWPNPQCSDGR